MYEYRIGRHCPVMTKLKNSACHREWEKNDSEVVFEISKAPKQNEEHWSSIKQRPYSLQLPVKVPKRIRKQGVRYHLQRHRMILKHVAGSGERAQGTGN